MFGITSVAVAGANGHTGRFVMEALEAAGVAAMPLTRSAVYLARNGAQRTARSLEIDRPEALDAVLSGADALINCAGPFFDTAEPLARAALRAGIPYLDVSAEQHTTRRLFEELSGPAEKTGAIVAPAMAFYGGLADLLASAVIGAGEPVDDIRIAVGLDSWQPTRGTVETGRRNTYERLMVRSGGLTPVGSPPPSRDWRFPPPIGLQPVVGVALSEMILLTRHTAARSITSFMNLKPLEDLRSPDAQPPEPVDGKGRSAQQFVLEVEADAGGETRRASAAGQDIYAVSAAMVVQACLDIGLLRGKVAGVRAPGELFDARRFLQRLAPEIRVSFDRR